MYLAACKNVIAFISFVLGTCSYTVQAHPLGGPCSQKWAEIKLVAGAMCVRQFTQDFTQKMCQENGYLVRIKASKTPSLLLNSENDDMWCVRSISETNREKSQTDEIRNRNHGNRQFLHNLIKRSISVFAFGNPSLPNGSRKKRKKGGNSG